LADHGQAVPGERVSAHVRGRHRADQPRVGAGRERVLPVPRHRAWWQDARPVPGAAARRRPLPAARERRAGRLPHAHAPLKRGPPMHYGCFMFATDYAIRPDELARALEDRGFESFWVPEHTHIPASRRSPFPGGTPLPKEYWHTLDPFVALGAAAAATSRIKLGTGICLVIERDPITLAKEVASLDWISRGRLLFGIGGGWNAEEM